MDEQKLENRLTKLEESLDYIGEDIEELKTTQADIHNLALSVNTLALQVKRLVDDMCKVDGRLAAIENKPAQRWDNIVKTMLTASVLAGVISMLTSVAGLPEVEEDVRPLFQGR